MQENKQEHFIKNIEIKNFKCFENFKAEGFGRVNLIGGKNNVGKTAFMEAIFIVSENNAESLGFMDSFVELEILRGLLESREIYIMRNVTRLFQKFNNLLIVATNNFKLHLEVKKNIFEEQYFFNDRNANIPQDKENIPFPRVKFNNFIPSYMIGNDLIVSIFDKIKTQRKREKLNQILNEFDSNILEFDIIEEKPQVFLNTVNKFQDVAELGHGLKRYIAIIGSILINKDGFLFLDELENGVHYTHLDKLWEIILSISKQQNVQVFATTHSKECIESYARAAKESKDKEIKYIKMSRLKDGQIMAGVRDYEMLQYTMNDGHEVRGI